MAGRMFGKVESVSSAPDDGVTVSIRVESGDVPEVGAGVQVLSGFFAARGALATDEHNALVDARQCLSAAIRAQVLKTRTYNRQQKMIYGLKHIDELFDRPAETTS